MIDRPRLQRTLVGRFEVPLTAIVAPAGSGKSSLIELAVDDNRLDPRGRDVVVPLRPRDAERTQFLSTVATALGIPAGVAGDPDHAEAAIHDVVWAAAPEDVAIWIDDAHVLDAEAMRTLSRLVLDLPGNGHLVVSTRRAPELGLARLRAQGRLLSLDADALRLDDDELERLAVDLGHADASADLAPGAVPRHAATAALLVATGGDSASIAFLQEEVIAGLGAARVEQLRRLVALDMVDEALARELTDDGELDLRRLVRDLPLVAIDDDTVRLHDLLREALAAEMPPSELRKVRSLTGDALAARHDYVGAVDAHLAAGDAISARAVARRYVRRPTVAQSAVETRALLRRMSDLDDSSPLVSALRATLLLSSNVWAEELDAWREIRDEWAGHDDEIESLALHRIAQARFLDIDPWVDVDEEILATRRRLQQLAGQVDLAGAAACHIGSQLAQGVGDATRALSELSGYARFEAPDDRMMRWQRLTDLGRVERVGEDLVPEDFAAMPPGSEAFLGYAMWLRGDGGPEVAEAAVGRMIESTSERGQHVVLASTIGTAVPIALACGDVETATRRVARLRELDRFGLPRTIRLFVAVAEGLLAAVEDSDEAGADRLASFGSVAQVGQWPLRPHLLALPFVYLAQPDRREALDAVETGPAITRALDAGRALVALRERDDPRPAAELAWSQPVLLRNHVLPHHLVELACAAHAADHPDAEAVLEQIPVLERWLRRVADQGAGLAAERAGQLLGGLPRRAPEPIAVRLLGTPTIERDGEEISLSQRTRPAELLAFLTAHGPATRDEVIEAIWGGYDDEDKASANLRATLTQLQRLLEPDRPRDVSPSHLRTVGTTLSLHDVSTDVAEFERLHMLAREADEAGTPRVALDRYREAMARYRGDFLVGQDPAWIVLDRLRLRSLASGASCRLAELLAARGDVEEAAGWARRALTYEPLSDRAATAFVRSLIATDDRVNAAAAYRELLAERTRAGVTPSASLLRLAERLPIAD